MLKPYAVIGGRDISAMDADFWIYTDSDSPFTNAGVLFKPDTCTKPFRESV